MALGDYSNVECHAFVGGTPIREDIKKLDNNSVHVISGTAGRVLDMMNRKKLRTQNIKMLVVEEADEMLRVTKGFRPKVDKGFREQIDEIYSHLPFAAQVVFLGITLPQSVLEVTTKLMKDPIRILLKHDESTLEGIEQYFVTVKKEDQKFDSLISLFDTFEIDRALVFCNSKGKVGAPELDERRRD
ncbi:RNA helicase [Tulasnella sp. 408]|nr:RNA helicase [Tulasnella sp. 408]